MASGRCGVGFCSALTAGMVTGAGVPDNVTGVIMVFVIVAPPDVDEMGVMIVEVCE